MSLINLEYMDLRTSMEKTGIAAIDAGRGTGEDRIEKTVKNALNGRLLDINDMTKAFGVLVHVSGGEDPTLEEVYRSGELVTRTISPESRIVWGARVNPELRGTAHVFIYLTGGERIPERTIEMTKIIQVHMTPPIFSEDRSSPSCDIVSYLASTEAGMDLLLAV